MDIEHNVISSIMALGHFWSKSGHIQYNSEAATYTVELVIFLV